MKFDLENKEWKEFIFEDFFEITSTTSGIDRNKLIARLGQYPYLTRTEKNNGYDAFICTQSEKYSLDASNVITIGLDTQTVFYQPFRFYTGQNIQILKCKRLNKDIAQFLIPLIKSQMTKFNWGGNGATLTRLRRSKIVIPVNSKGEPNFEFMELFIKQKKQEKLEQYRNYIKNKLDELKSYTEVEAVEKKDWKDFFIEDIVEIISGKDIYAKERTSGNIPYVSATANQNGIGYFVGNENKTLECKCLSVNRNGSVGYSFYHPYKALFSNDCRKLRLKNDNEYVGLFISLQITRQKDKYGYGYKMGTARLKRQRIMLPVNKDGLPDYDYMENFIKKIEYNKIQKYLIIKKTTNSQQ